MAREEVIAKAGSMFHTSSHFFRLKEWYEKHGGNDIADMERVLWCAHEGRVMYFSNIMSVYRTGTFGSWSQNLSLGNKSDRILDLMSRINYYEKFDKETSGIHHKSIKIICNSILNHVYYELRSYYRNFTLKRKFFRWLEISADLIGIWPITIKLRKYTEK